MTSKKATVFILDSNPSMGKWIKMFEASAFQKSKDAIQATLEEKLLAGRKTDQVSVVVAGTEETDHSLQDEFPEQYQHITELSAIKQPDLDLLRKFVNVPLLDSKKCSADVFDSLILAIQMINDHVRHYKYEKRIRLYMSLEGSTNWDSADAVVEQLCKNGIELSIACLNLKEAEGGKLDNPNAQLNLQQWKAIVESVPNAHLMDLSEAIAESMEFHKKDVRPTPTFRGFLTIGDKTLFPDTSLSISIMMYARTMEAKMPSAKKWSSLSSVTDVQNATGQESHQVVAESKYRLKPSTSRNETEENVDTTTTQEVEKSMLEKAYKFGKTLVTITEQDEEFLKLKTDASMTLLGTYSKNAFPPQILMSNCYIIVAGNDRPKYAAKALSALAQALQKSNLVALVRHVSKTDAPPKLGILKPVLQEDIDALYFIRVPFAEDIREYQFNPLDKVMTESGKVITENHPLLPSQEVRDAMADFVKGMAIGEPSDVEEKGAVTLDLDEMYNPSLWISKKAIIARALNPAAPLPELDPRLKRQQEPSALLVEQNKDRVNVLKRALNVKKVDREAKRNRYGGVKQDQAVPEKPSVAQVLQSQQDAVVKQEEQSNSQLRALLNYDVREISTINPVRDFTTMINNRDEDLVSDAVEQMCRIITELVTTSFGDRNYELAIECLVLLRATAAKEDESEAFNRYLYQLRDTCEPNKPDSRRRDFWDIIKRKHITLINSEEAGDSNVTPEEATKFLEEEEPTKDTLPPESLHGDTADDLLAMME